MTLAPGMDSATAQSRFEAKFRRGAADECWLWDAGRNGPYGKFWLGGRDLPAHRVAYELYRGHIPDGLTLDHLCRNRACVNPAHLEPVTLAENTRREWQVRPRSTHCAKGHEFTPENTYWPPNDYGRRCRTCINDLQRRRRGAMAA